MDELQDVIAVNLEILLCTGGPVVRIVGDLSQHHEPDSARLEYQDRRTIRRTRCDEGDKVSRRTDRDWETNPKYPDQS